MSAEVLIGDGELVHFAPHALRAAVLSEVHARPFTAISVPSRHSAFRIRYLSVYRCAG